MTTAITDFRCYICGKPLGRAFSLTALSKEVDRVFLMHNPCTKRVEQPAFIIKVVLDDNT